MVRGDERQCVTLRKSARSTSPLALSYLTREYIIPPLCCLDWCSSMSSFTLPEGYGLVILANVVGPAFVMAWLGGRVGSARKRLGVALPAMQAVPGQESSNGGKITEAQAREFNCLQRGHHNPLETMSDFRAASLVAGFVNPYVTAGAGLMWMVARVSWALGYDGKGGRYAGGFKIGLLHWVAFLMVVGMAGYKGVELSGLF